MVILLPQDPHCQHVILRIISQSKLLSSVLDFCSASYIFRLQIYWSRSFICLFSRSASFLDLIKADLNICHEEERILIPFRFQLLPTDLPHWIHSWKWQFKNLEVYAVNKKIFSIIVFELSSIILGIWVEFDNNS